ncbi:mannose-6-phosphate isomerase, class I [Pseudolysinimonas sp.]|jgi:mannose-6-phosphate isomerase|uniref:mannose-6-phosphate isomerase, class I n=1 Tax=Pseudolysinimonas sp. TaxID=2680009 RepID=UPI003783E562
MFVEITNEPRDYAWGSTTLIPELLGVAPDGRPQAEIWLGTHAGSPSRVVGRDGDLRDLVGELPFLLKILAAGTPLSLQAHPTTAQAQEGFARENAAGIPVDAPHRNYKDPHAKPEMIYALSEEFRALCGFRPVTETRTVLDAVRPGLLPGLRADADLPATFEWLLSGHPDVAEVVAEVTAIARDADGDSWATVRLLAAHYPGDPGVVISLLLHTVVLAHGEALYLPAGNIHAYLSGLGIELMGPSDNVLRCGLTPKHVDVPELLRIVDFTPVADPRLAPATADGLAVFAPIGAGWELLESRGERDLDADAPALLVVLDGEADAEGMQVAAPGFGAAADARVRLDGRVVIARAV